MLTGWSHNAKQDINLLLQIKNEPFLLEFLFFHLSIKRAQLFTSKLTVWLCITVKQCMQIVVIKHNPGDSEECLFLYQEWKLTDIFRYLWVNLKNLIEITNIARLGLGHSSSVSASWLNESSRLLRCSLAANNEHKLMHILNSVKPQMFPNYIMKCHIV